MADKMDISSELSRELTLFQITMMGLGMMIGAGVFLGIGNSIQVAGPGGVLLTFTLNGGIAQTGDETINSRQNLPKAILYSVYIVTITYVSVAFATVVAVKAGTHGVTGAPWEWIGQFRERGFGEAVARLIPMGNLLLTLAVIFASTSALNATIYSVTRALYALRRDRMVPSWSLFG